MFKDIIDILIKQVGRVIYVTLQGADVNAQDRKGTTPLSAVLRCFKHKHDNWPFSVKDTFNHYR